MKAVLSFLDLLPVDDLALIVVSDLITSLFFVVFTIEGAVVERPQRDAEVADVDDEEDVDKLENEEELIELSKPLLDVDDDVDETDIFSNGVDELLFEFELPRDRLAWCICLYVSLLTLESAREKIKEQT